MNLPEMRCSYGMRRGTFAALFKRLVGCHAVVRCDGAVMGHRRELQVPFERCKMASSTASCALCPNPRPLGPRGAGLLQPVV